MTRVPDYDDAEELMKLAIRRTVKDPEWFVRHVLQTSALDWQLEGINAMLDVRRAQEGLPTVVNHEALQRITVVSGHGTGKTHWLAMCAHIWNFINYGLIAVTAPKQDQVRTRFFYRYKRILNNAVPWYKAMIRTNNMSACINGDETWGIQGETASEPENLAGYHDNPQLFLVDEASSKRLDGMYQTIEGALSTLGSVLVEISNPTRITGEFASHHRRRGIKDMYYRMHVTADDAEELIAPSWKETMARKYGKDSQVYKVRVLGQFVDAGENQLVYMDWLEDARDAGEEFKPDGSVPELRIAADVADGGVDYSVITAANKYDSGLHVMSKSKHDYPKSRASILVAKEMIATMEKYGGTKEDTVFIVDAIGVGAGTAGYLMEEGYRTIAFIGGATSDGKRFRNKRSQGYIALRDDLRDGRIFFSKEYVGTEEEWDELCDQLTKIETVTGTERVEDVETKDSYKEREKKSPDEADSLMMLKANTTPTFARETGDLMVEAFGDLRTANADW